MKKVLFIPGYFGSTLIEKETKKLRWVRLSDFLHNKYDLSMTEAYSDLPCKNNLIDDQILMKVKLIPKVLEIESYDKALKNLKTFCDENDRSLHTVTYDWRDDFYESIKKISFKIKELTYDGSKLEVVAHSNGGLLISYFLRYGDQDFENAIESWDGLNYIEKVSIVASPLYGAYSLFKYVKDGTAVLKNKRLMGSLDYSTFKSSYFFLPPVKYQYGYLLKKGSEFKIFDIHNVDNWKKYKWGPYKENHQKEIPVNDEKFSLILKRAKKFQELMHADVSNFPKKELKIHLLRGEGLQTYFHPTFKNIKDISDYHYPKADRINGDGVVSYISSAPLNWFKLFYFEEETLRAEHLKIVSDLKYQRNILNFLSK